MRLQKLDAQRWNVALLVIAQATLGAQMPMIFTVGGLAGQSLSPNPCLATLPISIIVFGSMTTAVWMSRFMEANGRRAGFLIGAVAGMSGGLVGALALLVQSFALFLAASYLTGIYLSTYGFYRFAAADTASEAFRPRAISYVMAGGLVAAIIGPQLVKATADTHLVPFLGTYIMVAIVNVVGSLSVIFLDIPRPVPKPVGEVRIRSYRELLRTPPILVAIICAMVSYALMNLVMTSTPLAVVGCGFAPTHAADIVSAHVLAMFAPSFFTGGLIARFGAVRIVASGLVLLAMAGLFALLGTGLINFYAALITLGVGWNFGFIGATAMLVEAHKPEERGRVQGLNDAIVFGFVTLASLASGSLMNCSGGDPAAGWSAVNWAMLPFLLLASGAMFWLSRQRIAAS